MGDELLHDFSYRCREVDYQPGKLRPIIETVMGDLDFKAFIFSYETPSRDLWTAGVYDALHLEAIVSDRRCMDAPIMKDARTSWMPIMWEASDYRGHQNYARLFEMSLAVGYDRGITARVSGPLGEHAMIVGIYDRSHDEMMRALPYLSSALMVIGPYAAHAYRNSASDRSQDEISLTQREVECLEWSARGKTAWETACILSRSERTVIFHLQNAMRKLNVRSKQQAAVKAVKLGLIDA